jgi:hypothetical protein
MYGFEILTLTLREEHILSVFESRMLRRIFLFVIPFYFKSVIVHSANRVERRIQWHIEKFSVALLCN